MWEEAASIGKGSQPLCFKCVYRSDLPMNHLLDRFSSLPHSHRTVTVRVDKAQLHVTSCCGGAVSKPNTLTLR